MLLASGCASNKDTALSYDKDYLTSISDAMLDQILPSTTQEQVDQLEHLDDFAFQSQLYQMQLPVTPEGYLEASKAWLSAKDECGEYVSHGDYKIEPHKDKIVVTTRAEFKNRKADISFNFDSSNYLESITVSADYTSGEVLEKAVLNTILGMGTVFCVLIFISLIISLMKYIPAIQEKFMGKKSDDDDDNHVPVKAESPKPQVQNQEAIKAPAVSTQPGDEELVAVISAAIAASEGISEDGFVVRSIKRRPANKW